MTSDEKQILMSLLTYHDRWREQLLINIRDGINASDLMWKVEAYKKTVLEFENIMQSIGEEE